MFAELKAPDIVVGTAVREVAAVLVGRTRRYVCGASGARLPAYAVTSAEGCPTVLLEFDEGLVLRVHPSERLTVRTGKHAG